MKKIVLLVACTLFSSSFLPPSFAAPREEIKSARASEFVGRSPMIEVSGGRIVSVISEAGITKFEYKHGFLKSISKPDGSSRLFRYNDQGILSEVILPSGEIQKPLYDRSGGLVGFESASGSMLHIENAQQDGSRLFKIKRTAAQKKSHSISIEKSPQPSDVYLKDLQPDEGVITLLLATDGWETNFPDECDVTSNPAKAGSDDGANSTDDEVPCIIITAPAPGGGGGGGGGAGWGGGGGYTMPGDSGGGGGEGGGAGEPQTRQECLDRAYEAYDIMAKNVCNLVVNPYNRQQCHATNSALLAEANTKCRADFP